ncbi:MAG: type II toxin-antitoxin system VapC family toxin [Gammaproteobacteria bacterium]|nr:type II toxin-antitoxin system VapC family toxin [Gammaproteobacteria bacterium]
MTCVVVNDASCLIDLRKGQLLHVLSRLPYRFIVPLPIRESELLDFTPQEWATLDSLGMETYDLPPERMADVFALKRQHGRLTANDCFCLIATQCHEGGILLTGDSLLRKVATELGVKVHGVLWVIKELIAADVCDDALLIRALKIWKDDATVFLPKSEIEQQLRGILSTL